MGTVKRKIRIGAQPTKDVLEEIKSASKHKISYDKESPKLSKAQLQSFVPSYPEYFRPKKQQITLKLDADIIAAFKKTGKGYQTRMNAALRQAWKGGVSIRQASGLTGIRIGVIRRIRNG